MAQIALNLSIQICTEDDIPALNQFVIDAKHSIEERYFERAFQEQQDHKRIIFIARSMDAIVGYAHLNFFPQYTPFLRLGIPEIQDIIVHPESRRQGIAEQMMQACETEARARSISEIGVGVGVSGHFGSAQRLYHRMGYSPDGNGAVFERIPIQSGDIRPIDDRLCLMLVKNI